MNKKEDEESESKGGESIKVFLRMRPNKISKSLVDFSNNNIYI